MNPFHSIVATLLALLIASPLCCCSAHAGEPQGRPACCTGEAGKTGGDSPDPDPRACACKFKEPRETAKQLELPQDLAAPLDPVERASDAPGPPVPARLPRAATPHTGCDPPRLLLARYSRWLI